MDRQWSAQFSGKDVERIVTAAAFNFDVVRIVLADGSEIEGEVSHPSGRTDGDNFVFDRGGRDCTFRYDEVITIAVSDCLGHAPRDPFRWDQFE